MAEGNSRVRLGVVGIIVMALFSALFARLWFLQVGSSNATAAAETEANRIRVVTEPGVRGSILDRNGKVIVQNQLVDSIQVRRGLTRAEERLVVPNLSEALGVKRSLIKNRLDDPRLSPYQPVPVADGVPYEQLVYIKERPEMFPKVEAVRRSIRVYPNGSVGPHLLGYVGAMNKQEEKLHRGQGYEADDVIGKDGAELVFESELRGQPHVRRLEVDSRGRLVEVLEDQPAEAGNDVQLTMDLDIQRIAEESVLQGMRAARGQFDRETGRFKATGGAAVVLDARDGSIVALASEPGFDLVEFTNGLPIEKFKALSNPESQYPLLNRAVQGLYPAGSTFKLFSGVAALRSGVITPEFSFDDDGCIVFGDAGEERCNAGKVPNGPVNMQRALTVSSDVYFYNLGLRFWKRFDSGQEKLGYSVQEAAADFGFGLPTGAGLPNEARGRIPDEAWKRKFNTDSPDPFTRDWLPGDSMSLSVGQGDLLVTPLQLANAYAAFANGGTVYSPRLASKVLTPGSASDLRTLPPQPTHTFDLPKRVRDTVMPGLIGAVNSSEGTANAAFRGYTGVEVAGKTGTAEMANRQDNSLFVAIVNPNPAPDSGEPQYVVAVVIEEGGFGGSVAAPVARRIIEGLNGNLQPGAVVARPVRLNQVD